MPNKIQSGDLKKISIDGGIGGISHNTDGDPNVLNANRNDAGRNVDANHDHPSNQWNDDGCFAFPVSQLTSFLKADSVGF